MRTIDEKWITTYCLTTLIGLVVGLTGCADDATAIQNNTPSLIEKGKCTTDAECPTVAPKCDLSSGYCYRMIETEKIVEKPTIVYGSCTANEQCQGGRICEEGFCVYPTPVCGQDNLLANDNSLQSVNVTAKLESSVARYYPVANSAYPSDGDNLLPLNFEAKDSLTCEALEVTMVYITMKRLNDSTTPTPNWIEQKLEVQDASGQKIGQLTTMPWGNNTGTWLTMEYSWSGSIIINHGLGFEKQFNVVCTNCSSLPAHTTFHLETQYVRYRPASQASDSERYYRSHSRLTIYGNPGNVNNGATCSTIVTPNSTIEQVSSKVTPMLAPDSPSGSSAGGQNQLMQVVNLFAETNSGCHSSKITSVAFQVSSNRNLNYTYWELKDQYGTVLATKTFYSAETPSEGLMTFTFNSAVEVRPDSGTVPQLRLYANTSGFQALDMLSVRFNRSLTWTDTVTGNTYTAEANLIAKVFTY